MTETHSVSKWIRDLEAGDEEAARLLWHRYFDKLAVLARKQLGRAPRRIADEEDVALSVFRCLCDAAERDQLSGVASRDQLWRLLAVMTAHKVIDQKKAATAQKRGGGNVRGDSVFHADENANENNGFDQIIGNEPTPEFLASLAEEHRHLMDLLDDERLRGIALWRLQGYTNEEMASRLGLTPRSVERKLRRIRQMWLADLEP